LKNVKPHNPARTRPGYRPRVSGEKFKSIDYIQIAEFSIPSGRLIVSADSHRENRLASRRDLQTPKTPHQIREAQANQHVAAHDAGPQVRIIAGPGTGESFTIGE